MEDLCIDFEMELDDERREGRELASAPILDVAADELEFLELRAVEVTVELELVVIIDFLDLVGDFEGFDVG